MVPCDGCRAPAAVLLVDTATGDSSPRCFPCLDLLSEAVPDVVDALVAVPVSLAS
jgi:hypothetical protein